MCEVWALGSYSGALQVLVSNYGRHHLALYQSKIINGNNDGSEFTRESRLMFNKLEEKCNICEALLSNPSALKMFHCFREVEQSSSNHIKFL